MESVKRFKEEHGTDWTIQWHPGVQTPSIIYGSKTKTDPEIRSSGGDEKVARKFLSSFRDLFRIRYDDDEWVIEQRQSYAGIKYIDLVQAYRGIKVYSGSYTLSIDTDGGIRTIAGKFYPDIEMSIHPSISSEQAVQKACKYLQIPVSPTDPRLVIYPTELGGLRYRAETYVLAYEMYISAQHGAWIVFVDAKNGEVIRSESTLCNASGNVYLKDPENTPTLSTVTLSRQTAQSKLEGQYVRVYNYNGSTADNSRTQATESSGNFLYNASDGRLDEVNVYYHTDKFFNWFVSTFGLANTNYFNIYVHYGPGNNASANTTVTPQLLGFQDGDGIKVQGLSRKDDIIYHETQHIISSRLGLAFGSSELKALHEGYSDYFAASYTRDSIIGEWAFITYEEHLRKVFNDPAYFNYLNYDAVQYGRYVADNNPTNGSGTAHANGMIWSGALWDLRTALGRDASGNWISDDLIVRGLRIAHSDALNYFQAGEAIVSADYQSPYYGAHVGTIRSIFAARKFSEPSVIVSGPVCLCEGQTGTYNVSISGVVALPILSYQWASAIPCEMPQAASGTSSQGGCDYYTNIPGATGATLTIQSTAYKTLRIKIVDQIYRTLYGYLTINTPSGIIPDDPEYSPCNCGILLEKTVAGHSSGTTPDRFELEQNYPNPFNPATTIKFSMPEKSTVILKIYNIRGQEIRTLVNDQIPAGVYEVEWDGLDESGYAVSSGMYLYRLQSGAYVQTRKMILLK